MTRQGSRLKQRLFWSAALSIAAVIIAAVIAVAISATGDTDLIREQVLTLNDIREELKADPAITAEDTQAEPDAPGTPDAPDAANAADAALAQSQEALREAATAQESTAGFAIALIALIAIAAIFAMAFYLYRSVGRPFMKLEDFAEEVAVGNLDVPLAYERANPFGKFTWAFDHLRKELKRARMAEEQANEAHKTTLASLSHDLRTPLASLRAYAEALGMGLANSEAERDEYERAIMRKCDEASALVDDLFQHALADMDRIQVKSEPTQVAFVLESCVRGYAGIAPLTCERLDHAFVEADGARLAQIVDNLIGNSLKYARGTSVEVEGIANDDAYLVTVRDFGSGIPAHDLPFATERFYRGSNAEGQPGSGLGLFIASYLTERMGGHLRLENAHPGLRAQVELRITR